MAGVMGRSIRACGCGMWDPGIWLGTEVLAPEVAWGPARGGWVQRHETGEAGEPGGEGGAEGIDRRRLCVVRQTWCASASASVGVHPSSLRASVSSLCPGDRDSLRGGTVSGLKANGL